MRLPAIALLCLGAIPLAGCGVVPGTSTGVATPTLTLAQVVADAMLACQGLCAVAPTAASITSIILAAETNTSAVASEAVATQAADVFCKAVTGTTTTVGVKGGRLMKAVPHLRAAVPVGNGVVNYGTLTLNGKTIQLEGVPQS